MQTLRVGGYKLHHISSRCYCRNKIMHMQRDAEAFGIAGGAAGGKFSSTVQHAWHPPALEHVPAQLCPRGTLSRQLNACLPISYASGNPSCFLEESKTLGLEQKLCLRQKSALQQDGGHTSIHGLIYDNALIGALSVGLA